VQARVNASADDAAQDGFAYRLGWGLDGLRSLSPGCAVIVVVDVLRFTTAVCAALEAGATVLPFRWADDRAAAYADEHGAILAGRREDGRPSLSPTDLLQLDAGTRLVLPSPNGSTIAFEAARSGVEVVLAGSFRNATATARYALTIADGRPIGVVAAGERWDHTPDLRPCVEDLLGAGAVLRALDPSGAVSAPRCSPEARAARAAFADARPMLRDAIADGASGRELARIGFADDVDTAAAHDAATLVARLDATEFVPVVR
jgi:2-phosphosulfolactate phosphatase